MAFLGARLQGEGLTGRGLPRSVVMWPWKVLFRTAPWASRCPSCRFSSAFSRLSISRGFPSFSGPGGRFQERHRRIRDETTTLAKVPFPPQVGCNACVLSNLYLSDKQGREQFQKLYTQDFEACERPPRGPNREYSSALASRLASHRWGSLPLGGG